MPSQLIRGSSRHSAEESAPLGDICEVNSTVTLTSWKAAHKPVLIVYGGPSGRVLTTVSSEDLVTD